MPMKIIKVLFLKKARKMTTTKSGYDLWWKDRDGDRIFWI